MLPLLGLTILFLPRLLFGRAQSALSDGEWTTIPYLMPVNPIHCGLLHTGKIVVVVGSENEPDEDVYQAAVYDPTTGVITIQDLSWDVFCNGMAALPDGRFLVAGGTEQYDPFHGETRSSIFDPLTEKFNTVEKMAHGRWYATTTNLGDGRMMAFSGLDENGLTNKTVEIYQIGTGWSPEYLAPWTPPLYPRMHLLPDGTVFYSGWTTWSHTFSPVTNTWTLNVAKMIYPNDRVYGTSVLLPLRPENDYVPKVMIMGGSSPATNTVEIIDLSVPNPAWRSLPPMSQPRIELNAVILPTGKVLALGGSAIDNVPSTASLNGDLFDPVSETWSSAGVAVYPRLYHSCALLLPDATVWVAGSNPTRGIYEEHMEIYSRAYLFTTDGSGNVIPAVRPVITKAPDVMGYGGQFKVSTPDAARISDVVLIRAGSVTHAFDMEQRLIALSFGKNASALKVTAPPDGFIAPPGYYMLFVLDEAGVPSLAKFVRLTSTPNDRAPFGKITSPRTDVVVKAGSAVNFSGTATDRDGTVSGYYWIFPGGTPDKSTMQSPGPVIFNDVGIQVISMTSFDNLGLNDPSPPTRTIEVQP